MQGNLSVLLVTVGLQTWHLNMNILRRATDVEVKLNEKLGTRRQKLSLSVIF